MARAPVKVVLDTNISVSSLIFGGKPQQIENLILEKEVIGITSLSLLAELIDVLTKKFHFNEFRLKQAEKKIKKNFTLVQPTSAFKILKDDSDNRVLEAAVEGKCDFIVTGDKELLELKEFKGIKIVTPAELLTYPRQRIIKKSANLTLGEVNFN